MSKITRNALVIALIFLTVFAVYALLIRDNRIAGYVVTQVETGITYTPPENVQTERMMRTGLISAVSALILAVILGVDLAKRRGNTEQSNRE